MGGIRNDIEVLLTEWNNLERNADRIGLLLRVMEFAIRATIALAERAGEVDPEDFEAHISCQSDRETAIQPTGHQSYCLSFHSSSAVYRAPYPSHVMRKNNLGAALCPPCKKRQVLLSSFR